MTYIHVLLQSRPVLTENIQDLFLIGLERKEISSKKQEKVTFFGQAKNFLPNFVKRAPCISLLKVLK